MSNLSYQKNNPIQECLNHNRDAIKGFIFTENGSIEILKTDVFDDFAELDDFENAATSVDFVLIGFQVDFEVKATNREGESKPFYVVFQNEERSNGMKAYNGFEMQTASRYGCDSDDSAALEDFLNYDESFVMNLKKIANKLAKEKLKQMQEYEEQQ